VLREVYLARIASNQQQFQAGKAAGRREIVSTVHELLGIGMHLRHQSGAPCRGCSCPYCAEEADQFK
jgi:hypothetical protein